MSVHRIDSHAQLFPMSLLLLLHPILLLLHPIQLLVDLIESV
jgi:hypothetical protein